MSSTPTSLFSEQFVSALADAVAAKVASELSGQHSGAAKRLFTLPEAAAYIGRSPKAVEHLIARGTIPVTKLDGKRQIDRAALDKLITSNTYFES